MKLSDKEIRDIRANYSDLLNYEDEDPNAPIDPMSYVDSNGDGLLHIAAQKGDARTISMLLRAGMDPNLRGDMGNTALHYAKRQDVASLLIEKGASGEIRNEFGDLPKLRPSETR
jgi:ankyrin repeat protein